MILGLSTVEDGTVDGNSVKFTTGFIGRSSGSEDGDVQKVCKLAKS